ncbi:MAG: maltose alpha-D-glucosyltransferase [Anaerolineales bacterium]|jgi:maltose alpha-D-glucosyltransferase/alpha-amylase
MSDPLWYKNAVFYEVYVRAFYDSNGDGHGDLNGLTQKLDYLQSLGVDCLWLLPIYPSPLKDDGYDISDYTSIHADYGTLDDFKALLAAAHARNIRLIMDLVINHTSDQHPWFQAARSERDSPYRAYYVWSDSDQKYSKARVIFMDTEKSNWTWDESASQYFWHRFYSSQPDLNFDNPAVRAEILNIIRFWFELGVDGFRVDAVPYLFEREETTCENLPETHAFLKEMRRFVDQNYPGRILLCEANQWPEDVRTYLGEGDEFQLAFHFPLMPRIFMALRQGVAAPIEWALTHTPAIPENCQWCTFLRNHDELTLEMVTEEERQWMWKEYAPDARMRLNLGIRRRLAPLLDNDPQKIGLAFSLLFTLPGSPIIYYGDEIGMGDNIQLPDRNGVRTPMQWEGGLNAGFSKTTNVPYPIISVAPYGPDRVNVRDMRADHGSIWSRIRAMIALRKSHPALCCGNLEWVNFGTKSIAGYLRSDSRERVLAVHNLSSDLQDIRISLPANAHGEILDLLSGQMVAKTLEGLSLLLQPHEYHWLLIS